MAAFPAEEPEAVTDGFFGTHYPDGRIKDLFLVKDGKTFERNFEADTWEFAEGLPTDEEVWALSRNEAFRLYKEAPPLPPM